MAKIWEDYPCYDITRDYVNLMSRSCFRSVRIEGAERIPRKGAVLLAPNHCATLMDPLLILLFRLHNTAFGARSDIFAKPGVARILRWLRIVPIARERNGLAEVAKNLETFEEIIDCLEHESPFCLFSEGRHRPERGMLPVKKGIFRIARMTHERLGQPVSIVPIGIDYEDFFGGQGRLAIRVGEPMEISRAWEERAGLNEAEIYRELCEELQSRILALIGRLPERRHDRRALRLLAAILSLPLFVLCAVGSLPIWLPYRLLMHKMKDKAWAHTVRFALHGTLPLFVPFHIFFERLLRFYRNLAEDLR